MARDLFINLDADAEVALVQGLRSNLGTDVPPMVRESDLTVRFHFLRQNYEGAAMPFRYEDPTGWDLVAGAGGVGDQPTAGTFTLTDPVATQTTAAIAYNATAAAVQTAIRAGLTTNYLLATVTGSDGGPYTVTRAVNGDFDILTASSASLQPANSAVQRSETQVGTATLPAQFFLELTRAVPIGRSSGWTAFPSALVTPAVMQVGSGTANKVFSLIWNADAYAGDVTVAFTGNTATEGVGPLAFDATADDVAAAFAEHTDAADNEIQVQKVGPGSYQITCTGPDLGLSNTPALAIRSNTLQVPVGLQGTLSANTSGVFDLLAGEDEVTTRFEVRADSGDGFECLCIADVRVLANLLRSVNGVANPIDPTLTASQVIDLAIFDDAADRAATTPKRVGQPGFQLDTGTYYRADGVAAGDWTGDWFFATFATFETGVELTNGAAFVFTNGGGSTVLSSDPGADGVLTLPGENGFLAVAADSFSVTKSSNQSVAATTLTAITWQTEKWDTASWFASSKFTPQRAGKYRFNVGLNLSGGLPLEYIVYLYKNGALEKVIGMAHRSYINPAIGSCLASANGTTDNFEIRLYYYGTGPTDVAADDANTYFQGEYVGP